MAYFTSLSTGSRASDSIRFIRLLTQQGGPLINSLALLLASSCRQRTSPGSTGRELADTAVAVNAFIAGIGLLPIPGIDGASLLKWTLVQRGWSELQADQKIRLLNAPLAAGLAGGVLVSLRRKCWIWMLFLSALSVSAFAVAVGWLREL